MKKKFQLVLPLLTLPLLTSCPPSQHIEGPCFVVNNMDYGTTVDFALSDGFDIEVSFGLYDKTQEYVTESDNNRTFMFLVKDSHAAREWKPVYRIEEKYSTCGWKRALLNDDIILSKKATIHFGEELFTKEIGYLYLSIAEVLTANTDAESFYESSLSFPEYNHMDSELFSYFVSDTKVILKYGAWPSSKDSSSEQSSSESSWSEQSLSEESSSEQPPLDSSLSITSSEESVIELSHESL